MKRWGDIEVVQKPYGPDAVILWFYRCRGRVRVSMGNVICEPNEGRIIRKALRRIGIPSELWEPPVANDAKLQDKLAGEK